MDSADAPRSVQRKKRTLTDNSFAPTLPSTTIDTILAQPPQIPLELPNVSLQAVPTQPQTTLVRAFGVVKFEVEPKKTSFLSRALQGTRHSTAASPLPTTSRIPDASIARPQQQVTGARDLDITTIQKFSISAMLDCARQIVREHDKQWK
jgi:hypothetical protein